MKYEKLKYHLDYKFGDYGWNSHSCIGDDNKIESQEMIIADNMELYIKKFNSNIDDEIIIEEINDYKKWKTEDISLILKCLIEILEKNKFDLGEELYLDLSNSGTLIDEGNCRCYDVKEIEDFYFNSEYDLIKFKFRNENITINLYDYYLDDNDDCSFLSEMNDNHLCGKSNCIKDECSCWDGDSCLL